MKKSLTSSTAKIPRGGRIKREFSAWLLNGPYIIYTLVFMLIPLIWAIWLSATDWNLMSDSYNFVGIDNFVKLFSDKKVTASFVNAYRFMLPLVLLCVSCGIGIALLTSKLSNRFKGIASVLFFVPYLTSGVATSVMVKYIFSYNSLLNVFLREKMNINIMWFQSKAAFWILVVMIVWKMAGYYALFILSAIESVSDDIYEAAAIDGCHGVKKFFYITLPMILPAITSVLVLSAGLSFQIYSEPFLLTGGGPQNSTMTWLLHIYNVSFTNFKAGSGAAMAIINAVQIFATIQIIDVIMSKINNKFGG